MILKPSLNELNLSEHQTIFLRADLNVPIKEGKILEDYKINAILPTIDFILNKNCKIILATHLGRPKLENKEFTYDPEITTNILIPWFKQKGYKIKFSKNIESAVLDSKTSIILLENLRFFKGEQNQDIEFAKKLKYLANFYVNDAFALIHRNDTSITLLPKLFEENKKAFGLLMQKEFDSLTKIKKMPQQPLLLIIGGNKVKDKIPLIKAFLQKPQNEAPKSIIICGAMAYTFLKAQNISVGKSLIEEDSIEIAKNIIEEAKKQNIKIFLPIDSIGWFENKKIIINHEDFPKELAGFDIGPKSIKIFSQEISNAKTIFLNGTAGIYTDSNFAEGTKEILKAITKSDAYSIIGGGDGVAAAFLFKLQNKIDYLSTGGGATLNFLSISEKDELLLPGIHSIKETLCKSKK